MLFAPRHRTYSHQKWARAVKKKFNGRCALTGERGGQSHHLYSANDYPHLMSEVDNGVFIAEWVHRAFHVDFMGGYTVPCTKEDWERFEETLKEMIVWR